MTDAQFAAFSSCWDRWRDEQRMQHEQVVTLLMETRDAVREFVQVMTAPVEETPAPCTHSPEFRTDDNPSATFWKCKRCGYVYDSERETS
jgi:DNA-directed RNA polymerase subunit M/transcription elongation factor TFIIS